MHVGTSSGLGLALVRRVLARGDRVIATARALEGQEGRFAEPLLSLTDEWGKDRLRLLELDVSAPFAQVQRQAEAAIELWGRVDVLVNNAGTVGREFGPSEELGCVVLLFLCYLHTHILSSRWQSSASFLCEMVVWIETNVFLLNSRLEGMAAPFEVNFFGVVKVTNAFLPHMRSRGDGTIVIIGSRSVYFNEFPVSLRRSVV